MNIKKLKKEISRIGISPNRYSINSGLKIDAHILEECHEKWNYFYFDEKGFKRDERYFDNENDACNFLLERIKNESKPTKRFSSEEEALVHKY